MVGNRLLVQIGEALYGEGWETQLQRELHYSAQLFKKWAAGADTPDNLARELRTLVCRRLNSLQDERRSDTEARRKTLVELAHALLGPSCLLDNPYTLSRA